MDRLVLVDKAWLANALFCVGIVVSFFVSLHPWFLWDFEVLANAFACACLIGAYIVERTLPEPPEVKHSFVLAMLLCGLTRMGLFFVGGGNFFGFLSVIIDLVSFFFIFRAQGAQLRNALAVASRTMAVLLAVSLGAFVLYFLGRSFPATTIVYGDGAYSLMNFGFFVIQDYDAWQFLPRFQSVFLEPSHMAVAGVFLLMVDIGHWRRWYNVVMLVAIVVSFSVEAYVLLFLLFFLSKWIMRKNFVRNIVILVCLFGGIVAGSFVYNNGDNLLNELIMMRLEVDDGEMAGNNRTTDSFDAEFEGFLSSSDLFFGREMTELYGNAGYKAFLFQNGLIVSALMVAFYIVMLYNPKKKRPAVTAAILSFLHYVVRAHMMLSHCFIPMWYMARWFEYQPSADEAKLIEDEPGEPC